MSSSNFLWSRDLSHEEFLAAEQWFEDNRQLIGRTALRHSRNWISLQKNQFDFEEKDDLAVSLTKAAPRMAKIIFLLTWA